MKYKQTDIIFNKKINRYGCLFFSLMDIVEKHTGHTFAPSIIDQLYRSLIAKKYMDENCYVKNHAKVLEEALYFMGSVSKPVYVGAKYDPFYTDRKSWGEKNGQYMIMQYKTAHGNSHFRRPHYDPYSPDVRFTGLISIRFYDIK